MSPHTRSPEVQKRFESELQLVEIIARQVIRSLGPGAELDELISFGHEGLLEAAERFDASRGVPFRAYANFRVKGAILDGVRSLSRLPRRLHQQLNALSSAFGVSEGASEDYFGGPKPTGMEAEAALSERLAVMATAIAVGLVAKPACGDENELEAVSDAEDAEEALQKAQFAGLVRDAIADLPFEEAELVRRHYLEGERFDHVAQELGLSKSWASRLHARAISRLNKRLRPLDAP